MKRCILIAVAFVFVDFEVRACSICGDGFQRRQTLRQRYADARLVVFGQLRNPKPSADGINGTTEFHISQTLKADAKLATPPMIVIPRYYPIIGATPNEFLFCSIVDGQFVPETGDPATATTVKYIAEAAKIEKEPLNYFLAHLESKDAKIAEDAFLEFAQASDRDIAVMASRYDRVRLRAWIADPKVSEAHIGVYALMLGLCGTADDAAWMASLLKVPRAERFTANLGGLLAGFIVLDPAKGWTLLNDTLVSKNYAERLSAIGCLRYLQNTRGKESREAILKACAILLADADLCDIAIEDLCRWGWWELTPDVLKVFTEKSSPLLKRGIVRYALSCPNAEAKGFIEKLRVSDPKLIAKVEESMNKK